MITELKEGDILVVKDVPPWEKDERLARVVKVYPQSGELLVELKRRVSDHYSGQRIIDISDIVRVEARV